MLTHDHLVGAFLMAVLFITVICFFQMKRMLKIMSYEPPGLDRWWTVGDFKMLFDGLPDEMPVILNDLSTDDDESANYQFDSDLIDIEDYYKSNDYSMLDDSDESKIPYGLPAGKAVFLFFDNKLNDNPIRID